jgi:ribonucleoside-diphosphate reductase beta chain
MSRGQISEYLLDPRHNERLTLDEIEEPGIWDLFEKQEATMWTVGHFMDALPKDREQFPSLEPGIQHLILTVLSFFAASDKIVNINLQERFCNEVTLYEAQCFYDLQKHMENVHARTYGLLIASYVPDHRERQKIKEAVKHTRTVKQKADWAKKWIESDASFAQRLLAFAIVEGVYFCGSFCVIFWIMEKNILPGLTTSNEWISRDEYLHTQFAIHLYTHYIQNRVPPAEVEAMIREAVEIESEFIRDALPEKLVGMNADLMTQYIQYTADELLSDLGYSRLYNVSCPFPFMEKLGMDRRTNFFELVTTGYNRYGAGIQEGGFEVDSVLSHYALEKSEAYGNLVDQKMPQDKRTPLSARC